MTAFRIVIFTASCLLAQQTQAQNMLSPMSEKHRVSATTAQLSSPQNYSLLEPIGSRAKVIKPLGNGSIDSETGADPANRFQWKSRLLVPLVVDDAEKQVAAANRTTSAQRVAAAVMATEQHTFEDPPAPPALLRQEESAQRGFASQGFPQQPVQSRPEQNQPVQRSLANHEEEGLTEWHFSDQDDLEQSPLAQSPLAQSPPAQSPEQLGLEQRFAEQTDQEPNPPQQLDLEDRYSEQAQQQTQPYTQQNLPKQALSPLLPQQTAPQQVASEQASTEPSYSIEVAPISFKSGVFDQYEFAIRNPGSKTLSQATVMLKAPEGCLVQQVIPKPDLVNAGDVQFSVDELAPGAEQVIEILIENPRNELARFETVIVSEKWSGEAASVTPAAIANTSQYPQPTENTMLSPIDSADSIGFETRVPAMTASSTKVRSDAADTTPFDLAEFGSNLTGSIQDRATTRRIHDQKHILFPEKTGPVYGDTFTPTPVELGDTSEQFFDIASSITGPTELRIGQEAEFAVTLENQSTSPSGSLIVQLSIPRGLKVTVLDRDSWYDADSRKISWEVPAIEARSFETIRYKAVFKFPGAIKQGIVVGMDETLQGYCSLTTNTR